MSTEQIAPQDVRHGDVIQDHQSGRWITVTRVVNGHVAVSETSGTERSHDAADAVTFYGDGRLDEQFTVAADATVSRKSRG